MTHGGMSILTLSYLPVNKSFLHILLFTLNIIRNVTLTQNRLVGIAGEGSLVLFPSTLKIDEIDDKEQDALRMR